ncbi:MAG: peroxidase-related enzyme [Gemmatimonadota bacterium]|nr:peroxidase-related enzyme [Gemmatimonadota bacterium]
MHHHGGSLRALTKDPALVEAVLADPRSASVPPRWRTLADVAITLTAEPAAVTDEQVRRLRDQGLTDAGVHDVVAITAYFNFVNRMAEGLALPIE